MGLLRIIRVPYQPVRSLTVVCTIYKCHVNWCGCTQYRVCWCGGPVTQDDITAAEAERAKLKAKEVQPINRHSWFAQTSFAAVTATDPRSICTTLAARRSASVSRCQLPVFGENSEYFLIRFFLSFRPFGFEVLHLFLEARIHEREKILFQIPVRYSGSSVISPVPSPRAAVNQEGANPAFVFFV